MKVINQNSTIKNQVTISAEFEVGDIVDYHSIIGHKSNYTGEITKIEREPNNFGCDVAWIAGFRGCVDLTHLTHV